jgi:hypothetical protein
MTPDEVARQLHRRYSRGESLSPEEQAVLDAWYARHDAEGRIIVSHRGATAAVEAQMANTTAILHEIRELTRRIDAVIASTEAVRRENQELLRQLLQRQTTQPA